MNNKKVEALFLEMEHELRLEMFKLTNDPELVNDSYQDAYLKLHKYISSGKDWYGNETSIRFVLKVMVKNIVLDKLRKKTSSKLVFTEETYMMTEETTPEDRFVEMESQPINEQVNKKIDNALKVMTPEMFMTYKLRMKGMKFKEIAYYTDCGINTALGRMRYAVLKIEEALNYDGD